MSTSKASRLVTIFAALSASAHGVAGELPLRSNALARYLAEMVHGFANVSLSPDGARACRVVLREDGTTAVEVFDWASGGRTRPLTATLAEDDLTACMWSSDSRLIVQVATWSLNSQTPRQLEAVNVDGSALKKLGWLDLLSFAPEEPELITVSTGWTFGVIDTVTGGGKLSKPSLSPAHHLITDGNGILRALARYSRYGDQWFVRAPTDRRWTPFPNPEPPPSHWYPVSAREVPFEPVAFDASERLLYVALRDNSFALFARNADATTEAVFAHPTQDLIDLKTLGKTLRGVAAVHYDGLRHLDYFDSRVNEVRAMASRSFAGREVDVLDEDWGRRFYLLRVRGELDWGDYYRYDTSTDTFSPLPFDEPPVRERRVPRRVSYEASDGAAISSYVFEPADRERRAAVILPQLAPITELGLDAWDAEFLAQYLAASGYVVLEPAVRGALGYGVPEDDRPHLAYVSRAAEDIVQAADYLVRSSLADADKICVVGAGFGGTAALVAAIDHPDTLRCVTSLSAPMELPRLYSVMRGDDKSLLFGDDAGALDALSPSRRVSEIVVPLQLVHGREDQFFSASDAKTLQSRLEKLQKPAELVEYPKTFGDIPRPAYRADFLIRVTEFLDAHSK